MHQLETTAFSTDTDRVLGRLASRLPAEIRLPLVSVIVTAYNCERFIRRTLDSVVTQTYENLECIIVEDCSTDGTLVEIEDFLSEQHDARFHLLRHSDNRGQLGAQITGFREAHGGFVVFLDADDVLFPDCLEAHVSVHLNCAPIAAMTCLDSATIDADGTLLSTHHREVRPRLWKWFRPMGSEKMLDVLGESTECRIVPPSVANLIVLTDQYFWTTQSFMMFRSDLLALVLPDDTEHFRVCSDYYLVHMAHAFNTTIMVCRTGGAYRIHDSNHFTHRTLISSDQQSGDMTRFAWQADQLAALAASLIVERFDRFAAVFGEFHILRALVGLPGKVRPRVLPLMRRTTPFGRSLFFLGIAWASRFVAKRRGSWQTFLRVIWSGD